MKKAPIIVLVLLCALALHAGEFIPVGTNGWHEDFNSFEGTYESLPTGFCVSKNGSSLMGADDSDFRGVNDGNLSTGGCYAWEPAVSNRALGYQPTTEEFTPGYFGADLSNSTTRVFRFLKIRYDLVYLNNENRSSMLRLEIRDQDGNMSTAGTVATPAAENSPAAWTRVTISRLIPLSAELEPGKTFKIRWYSDDSAGSGARDEFGIDNVYINGFRSIGTVITVR